MKKTTTNIFTLIGIFLVIIGLVIDFKIAPYQTLKYPLDFLNIEIIVIGFSMLTSIFIKAAKNKFFENTMVTALPILLVLKYGFDVLLTTETHSETNDLFISIFRLTYPISIIVIIVQLVSVKSTNRKITLLSTIIGLLWTLISIFELIRFLDKRQGDAIYAIEPKNILTFVLIMSLILTWTILKINNLKRENK